MNIRIVGWRYRNIRGGLGDAAIDLTATPPRWTFVQMPNGMGKTTTMGLFRAAFTGQRLTGETVRSLRPEDGAANGSFELRILVDGQLYLIELHLDYGSGQHRYTTSKAEVLGGGLQAGHALPSDVRSLMTLSFAELFIFDGELARKIRDNSAGRAKSAIRTLYGLDRLGQLHEAIERQLQEEQRRVSAITSSTAKTGVTRLQRELAQAQDRLGVLRGQQSELIGRRDHAKSECHRITALIQDRIEQNATIREELEALRIKIEGVDRAILIETNELRVHLRSPLLAAPQSLERLRLLSTRLHALQLPQTATAEFFEELASQEKCVCDAEITESVRDIIREKATTFMAANEVAVINAMKSAVRTTNTNPLEVTELVARLAGRLRERQRIVQERDRRKADYIAAGGDELKALQKEASDREREVGQCESELERLESSDLGFRIVKGLTWEHNIPACEEEIEERELRYNTATNTNKLLVQSRAAQHVLKNVEQEALNRIAERVRLATNGKLAHLVPAEQLQVVRIDGALELSSRGLARKENVSEGQSLAVAYAFLASLFEGATYRLPFVIDSPAIPLDAQVRREVVNIIPDLFEQTIMFVISTERSNFADAFYDRPEAKFITLARGDENRTLRLEGVEAFRDFQDPEEEDQQDGSADGAAG